MKSVILASVLTFGSVSSFVVAGSQAAYAQELQQITGIQVNPDGEGIQIEVETSSGSAPRFLPPSPNYRNVLVIDLLDAQLASGSFSQNDPAPGILSVSVDRRTEDSVRLTIIGSEQLPLVNVQAGDPGVIVSLGGQVQDPVAVQPDPVPTVDPAPIVVEPTGDPTPVVKVPDLELEEITVTAERPDIYNPSTGSVGTGTDTPLRDIPQSIQVITNQVLEDQNVISLPEALKNVSGISLLTSSDDQGASYTARGFDISGRSGNVLRNGLREGGDQSQELNPNIERIEVLLGPSSVLYGTGSPGGTLNLVTKQPLSEPTYSIDASLGSYGFYRGAFDFSGPLNESRTVLYRLTGSYQERDSFIDFFNSSYLFISPVISWQIGERTLLTLEADYSDRDAVVNSGLPPIGTVLPNPNGQIPLNRLTSEPDSILNVSRYRFGYRLEHEFNENWSLDHALQVKAQRNRNRNDFVVLADGLAEDNRTLNRSDATVRAEFPDFDVAFNLTGNFSTGSIEHQLAAGTDFSRSGLRVVLAFRTGIPIDIFNPVYGQVSNELFETIVDDDTVTEALGFYIQDQITFSDQLKVLIGGRLDTFTRNNPNFLTNTERSRPGSAFSPRIGVVYQPIEPLSLYASYSIFICKLQSLIQSNFLWNCL